MRLDQSLSSRRRKRARVTYRFLASGLKAPETPSRDIDVFNNPSCHIARRLRSVPLSPQKRSAIQPCPAKPKQTQSASSASHIAADQ